MIRPALIAALLALPVAAPAAEDKETSCAFQGQVMAAVRQARLDRVPQGDVLDTILAADPAWPAQYNNAIPQLTAHVYALKMRDVRQTDLGALMQQQCLANWDQIQQMQKQLKSD
ncbi:MAG TPA: hypothetical protein DEA05_13990 [Rhodobacteraceae bacterium]|nr:hypothetical protein [Paracoccaceae bacterium]